MYGGGPVAGSAAVAGGMYEFTPDFNSKRETGKKSSSFKSNQDAVYRT